VVSLVASAATCKDENGTSEATTTTTGGGGCMMVMPECNFRVTVRTGDRMPFPPDTEFTFDGNEWEAHTIELDAPDTYHAIDVIISALDDQMPPPTDLLEVEFCVLTSGALEVDVTAMGYEPAMPEAFPNGFDDCMNALEQDVEIELDPLGTGGGGGMP
jgi:hypothetical protein